MKNQTYGHEQHCIKKACDINKWSAGIFEDNGFTLWNVDKRLLSLRPLKGLQDVLSGWLLFNVNPANFQLYHDENKLIFNEMMMMSALF
jgi:hypothetical protein